MAETKKTAKHFESLTAPGRHADAGGLYLVIVGKSRTWMFRYKRAGKGHWMGLGPDSLVSLATARDAAIDARRLLRQGIGSEVCCAFAGKEIKKIPRTQKRTKRMRLSEMFNVSYLNVLSTNAPYLKQ